MMLNNFYQRKAPFLHRNWLQGITNWQGPAEVMGNIVSSQLRGDGRAAPPPRKRRRVSTPDSLNIDRPIVSPETFDTPSTLRIEVRRICHKDSLRFRTTSLDGTAPSALTTTQANCRVTVTNTSSGARDILYCHKQACDLTTSENPTGPHHITRVNMEAPFLLPRDVFLVPGDDDARDDLADTYELLIQFEQRNGSIWPPLTAKDLGSLSALQDANPSDNRKIVLKSRFHEIFGKLKEPLVLSIQGSMDKSDSLTEYIMDVDLRWSSGFNASTRPNKDSVSSITAIDRSTDVHDERLPPVAAVDPAAISSTAHREGIAEFSDVTPQEKEYIWEWDGYILKQNITANAYLPRAWLGFVQQKAAWLVAKDERMREYGKHVCVLLARDLLTDEVIKQAQGCIREARALRKMYVDNTILSEGVEQAAATSKGAGVRKSSKGCPVCQLPVLGPRLLVCANKACPKRLYHSNCVEPIALVDVKDRNWICNVCAASTT
ncbi:Zinc finger domain-containing protein, PHD-finger [Cordyceps fumosorosea ARSEF 2679]|uniref:Zinc finger domain-containing protein, PHD-finger n=1 Tax=Cordyceps fumosorosea (strain ARSEF 2679) TaxID=1081104 RepID=A0A167XJY4_CORFA|nr:Zinc finger domain-containing protein, PHD-finger [Cordyceps fumosorosea ARSEF 2679]OAA65065.1 Zinc finger domain-containing protein, PHD-finger [Cordyceps fumosorosea ARSEF 2679]